MMGIRQNGVAVLIALLVGSSSSYSSSPVVQPADDIASFSSALSAVSSTSSTLSTCWQSILDAGLYSRYHHNSPSSTYSSSANGMCGGMTATDAKELAYLLSLCHLHESGRGRLAPSSPQCDVVVQDPSTHGGFLVRLGASDAGQGDGSLVPCLKDLSEHEFQIYTHMHAHVFTICDRLTSNHWHKVTGGHVALLTATAGSVASGLTAVRGGVDEIMRLQEDVQASQGRLEETQAKNLERSESILLSQESSVEALSALSGTIGNISSSVTSLSGGLATLERALGVLSSNLSYLESSLQGSMWSMLYKLSTYVHFVVFLNVAHLLSSTPCTRSARPALFFLVLVSALLEYLSNFFASDDGGRILSEEWQTYLIGKARGGALFVGLAAVLHSFLRHVASTAGAMLPRSRSKQTAAGNQAEGGGNEKVLIVADKKIPTKEGVEGEREKSSVSRTTSTASLPASSLQQSSTSTSLIVSAAQAVSPSSPSPISRVTVEEVAFLADVLVQRRMQIAGNAPSTGQQAQNFTFGPSKVYGRGGERGESMGKDDDESERMQTREREEGEGGQRKGRNEREEDEQDRGEGDQDNQDEEDQGRNKTKRGDENDSTDRDAKKLRRKSSSASSSRLSSSASSTSSSLFHSCSEGGQSEEPPVAADPSTLESQHDSDSDVVVVLTSRSSLSSIPSSKRKVGGGAGAPAGEGNTEEPKKAKGNEGGAVVDGGKGKATPAMRKRRSSSGGETSASTLGSKGD